MTMADSNPIWRVRTEVTHQGVTCPVNAERVGIDGDRRPWRVDAPGEPYDGWLLADHEVFRPEATR
jgi:hypothetical protein